MSPGFVSRRQQGQTLVETALVLPLVLVLLAGTLVLGRGGNIWESLNNAAREGARYASLPAENSATLPSPAAVQQRVQQFAAASGVNLSSSDITVNQAVAIAEGGLATTFSEVAVSYRYSIAVPFLAALVPSVTLSANATMRNETN